ncbi:MAG: 1-acyl-sn-glycerol-3-phosphate acyltransferase [Clostridia bacterium]|nr:1-acyl-sn-glycerol-3-phosphate acyltransferase [Clostridia bacterium]
MEQKLSGLFKRAFSAVAFSLIAAFGRIVFGAKRTKDSDKIEGSAVIYCSHSSIFDFSYLVYAAYPKRIRFVARSFEFHKHPLYTWVLETLGFIPKKQGTTDVKCVREIVRACRAGEIVALYPAGMTSFDGRPAWDMQSGSGTLARLLATNVYVCTLHGAFLSAPRYTGKVSLGRVDVRLKKLFSAEEVKQTQPDVLQHAIEQALDFNDWDWQENRRARFFRIKKMTGMNRVLYRCPVCAKEGDMVSEKKTLVCKACGLTVHRDKHGFLKSSDEKCPSRMDHWVDGQLESLKKELADPDFALSDSVTLLTPIENETKYTSSDEGTLTLTKDALAFSGKKDTLCWPLHDFQYFILNDVDFLHILTGDTTFRFVFKNTALIDKWFFAHRLMTNGWTGGA